MQLTRAPAQRRGNPARRTVRSTTIAAPVGGYDAKNPLASMPPLAAVQLKNWFPQPGYVEVRRGHKQHAFGLSDSPVETLAVWQGPTSSKLKAIAGGDIYDVSVSGTASVSHSASFASNRWQSTNHTTAAGQFLFLCNGVDAPLHYNGTTWTAPTITNITASNAVQAVSHKKRLWMVLADSTKAAYLATDAVAGSATEFQFGSLFSRGGYLNALATWTRDGGSGADDYLVGISSQGQAAVYQGTDPSSASTWSLVGVFDVPRPIGRRCFTKLGGDLLLITLEGAFPLSQLLSVDQSQVGRVAITDSIAPVFNTAARSYASNFGWEICVYPKGTRLFVNVPTAEDSAAIQYVQNTITGAWCEYDAHNAICWTIFNDRPYFGGEGGVVYEADTGSADIDSPVVATGQCAYSAFGTAQLKRFSMIRPLITTSNTNRPSVGISTDFVETSNLSALQTANVVGAAMWDVSSWDAASWASSVAEVSDWANASALGSFGSIKFQARTGISVGGGAWGISRWGQSLWGSEGRSDETMRIQGFVLLYEPGEFL